MKNRRRFTITIGSILMVCMLAVGYAAVSAEYGGTDSPVITQDYVQLVLMPSADASGKGQAAGRQSALEQKILDMSQAIDDKVAAFATKLTNGKKAKKAASSQQEEDSEDEWKRISMTGGQTLRLEVDSILVVNKGGGVCLESSGTGLTDLSAGSNVLSADEALITEHEYTAATRNAGFRATEDSDVQVLGNYTLE